MFIWSKLSFAQYASKINGSRKRKNMNVTDFSLKHTLDSGQFFRYTFDGKKYHLSERDAHFVVWQQRDEIGFSGTDEAHIRRLFGLDQKYSEIMRTLRKDKTLVPALDDYHGMRIMQRDLWETLISFQCSIMSNIKKIQLNMNLLSQEFGHEKNGRFSFPLPGAIDDLERIKKCATGFRAKYILAANSIVTEKWMAKLRKMKYADAHAALMEVPGIAEKVADCICLFALGHFEAFPVDVWIERIMQEQYFGGKKTKHKDIRTFALERWGPLAGYAQQFLYHHARHQTRTN